MEEESPTNQSPLILGKPFLKIARTKIDVYEGILFIEFRDNVVRFNILDSLSEIRMDHSIFKIELLELLVQEALPNIINKYAFLEANKRLSIIIA